MNGVPYKPIDFRFVQSTRNKLVEELNITLYPNGPIASNSPDPHPIKAQHIWKIYEYFQAKVKIIQLLHLGNEDSIKN